MPDEKERREGKEGCVARPEKSKFRSSGGELGAES